MNESNRMAELSFGQGDHASETTRRRGGESLARGAGQQVPGAVQGDAARALAPRDDTAVRMWSADDVVTADREPSRADFGVGLATFGFIWAALRRSALILCLSGLLGLLAGVGYYVARPPVYQATATVLLAPATYPAEILDDQQIAQSRTVAATALGLLGVHESPQSFLTQYTALGPTGRILIITAKATSPEGAVREANAVAAAFLKVQANLLKIQDQLVVTATQRQIAQDQQNINSLAKQISQLPNQNATPGQKAELSDLRSKHAQAINALTALQQANVTNQASMRMTTTTTVEGSKVLDAAVPVVKSRLKLRLIYAVVGLFGGLAIGAAIVIIRALVSDRLRRRDDVARTLGAPVKLSVGKVSIGRGSHRGRHPAGSGGAELGRVAAYLGRAVPTVRSGIAGLAVIPVDDCDVAVWSVVSLARDCADRGLRVAVADMCSGSPAARMLGVTTPGVHGVSDGNSRLLVAVPAADDIAPAGPLDAEPRPSLHGQTDQPLWAACSSADLLLTLTSLDPSLGGDHLAGWAQSAVVMVTAGRSSAERIHAVGEMIRLAGIDQVSAVLIGADKADASLGTTSTSATADVGAVPAMAAEHREV